MISYKSINQQNTSLEAREAYYKSICQQISQPSVFLQTCNRVELYSGNGDVPDSVARHLFRVVSGLESALIGEQAVQGQVKNAYLTAREQYHLPAQMHKLFESALLVGKRVRNETEISHGAVSHSLAAIEILEKEHIDLIKAHITIIGVNKLTSDILKFLKNKGAQNVFLANRSIDKAQALAEDMGYQAYGLEDKKQWLEDTDILISATSAPQLIVKREDIKTDKHLLAIDLAFPRDIDPELAKDKWVTLYNITDVEHRVQHNISVRLSEVKKAENIIEEEITELQETLQRRKEYLQYKKV
jgi:glutamyl-tRNA reductase